MREHNSVFIYTNNECWTNEGISNYVFVLQFIKKFNAKKSVLNQTKNLHDFVNFVNFLKIMSCNVKYELCCLLI